MCHYHAVVVNPDSHRRLTLALLDHLASHLYRNSRNQYQD